MSTSASSTPQKPVKIIVAGDVLGRFHLLFSKVQALHTNHKFDALFCVGKFFSETVTDFKGAEDEESAKYLTMESPIPLPTFFIDGGSGAEHIPSDVVTGGPIAHNLTFLGKRGIAAIKGLNVAYLSGVYDPFVYRGTTVDTLQNYRDVDVTSLVSALTSKEYHNKIDVLLTSEWPRDILNNIPKGAYPTPPPSKAATDSGRPSLGDGEDESLDDLMAQYQQGSNRRKMLRSGDDEVREKAKIRESTNPAQWGATPIAELLKTAAPRYHFAANHNVFYQRPPYLNVGKEDEPPMVTRFLSLAEVSQSNTSPTQKYLYAANLTPVATMSVEQLKQQSANAVTSPFVFIKQDKDSQKRQRGGDANDESGSGKRQRTYQNQLADCWFCFTSPKVEEHLVVSVGSEVYAALPKGGITDEHVLVLPVGHYPSLLHLPDSTYREMMSYIDALKRCFAAKNMSLIIYERNTVTRGQIHMHLQVLPVHNDKVSNADVTNAFISLGRRYNMSFTTHEKTIDWRDVLQQARCDKQSAYFLVETPDGTRLLHKLGKQDRHPMQFGREALVRVVGLPAERTDWKACVLSRDREAQIASQFKRMFKPFLSSATESSTSE